MLIHNLHLNDINLGAVHVKVLGGADVLETRATRRDHLSLIIHGLTLRIPATDE